VGAGTAVPGGREVFAGARLRHRAASEVDDPDAGSVHGDPCGSAKPPPVPDGDRTRLPSLALNSAAVR
jgi:hypothetical protein